MTHAIEQLKPGLSVVVPVYNSCDTLGELIARLHGVLEATGRAYELILVNDGSHDDSWDEIQRLAGAYDWVHGTNLMRNYGQHSALLCGVRSATMDTVITMDDDLQNPPEDIPKLIEELDKGYDLVYGTPLTQQQGFWRNLAAFITKLALRIALGVRTARKVTSFRAFRTELRRAFAGYCGSFVALDVLLSWGTNKVGSVTVRQEDRAAGLSNYTFTKLVQTAMNMVTGFSTAPLQVASLVGFSFVFFGICLLFYVIYLRLVYQRQVPGFAITLCSISLFAGAQLFALGIIGEYLARMHFRLMGKPPYVPRDRTDMPTWRDEGDGDGAS